MAFKVKLDMQDTEVSAKGFFLKDGRVLLVKPAGSDNKYDIPGGKIKFGESKEQGLFRECLEEIGEDKERKKIYFVVQDWDGEIKLQLEEIEKYRWVPLSKVLNYSLTKTAYNGFVHYLSL